MTLDRMEDCDMFDGQPDPGNKKHYAYMNEARDRINAILLPSGASVTYVGGLFGRIMAIWYFGKKETGFAGGPTPEAVAQDVFNSVFGGL